VAPDPGKAGCNSTACHGSPAGKNGFKLSLFGYEPLRTMSPSPKTAAGGVLTQGPSAQPHHAEADALDPACGGQRFKLNSPEYRTILAWRQAGAPGISEGEPTFSSDGHARGAVDAGAVARQHLGVSATLSDGSTRDVTDKALFRSNDDAMAGRRGERCRDRQEVRRDGDHGRCMGPVTVSGSRSCPPGSPALSGAGAEQHIDSSSRQVRKLRVVPAALHRCEFIRRAPGHLRDHPTVGRCARRRRSFAQQAGGADRTSSSTARIRRSLDPEWNESAETIRG